MTQSGQSLSFPPEETLDPWLPVERLSFENSDQPERMRRSAACVYAQADPSLQWAHMRTDTGSNQTFCRQVLVHWTLYRINFNILKCFKNEPRHETSNNVVCATSKDSYVQSDLRAYASRLNTL